MEEKKQAGARLEDVVGMHGIARAVRTAAEYDLLTMPEIAEALAGMENYLAAMRTGIEAVESAEDDETTTAGAVTKVVSVSGGPGVKKN